MRMKRPILFDYWLPRRVAAMWAMQATEITYYTYQQSSPQVKFVKQSRPQFVTKFLILI